MDYVKHASTSPMKNVFCRFYTMVQNLAPKFHLKKGGILKFLVKFQEAVFGSFTKGKGYFDNSIVEADSDISIFNSPP